MVPSDQDRCRTAHIIDVRMPDILPTQIPECKVMTAVIGQNAAGTEMDPLDLDVASLAQIDNATAAFGFYFQRVRVFSAGCFQFRAWVRGRNRRE